MFIIPDRRAGIRKALELAGKDDIVLITGKGAEQSIVVDGKSSPWDDRKVVREELVKAVMSNPNQKVETDMNLPRFFNVDGTFVKFTLGADNNVLSRTSDGNPFPFGKALEGKEITEAEFKRLAAL
jgi:hypothetical protein